jgi:hypothetical protein
MVKRSRGRRARVSKLSKIKRGNGFLGFLYGGVKALWTSNIGGEHLGTEDNDWSDTQVLARSGGGRRSYHPFVLL